VLLGWLSCSCSRCTRIWCRGVAGQHHASGGAQVGEWQCVCCGAKRCMRGGLVLRLRPWPAAAACDLPSFRCGAGARLRHPANQCQQCILHAPGQHTWQRKRTRYCGKPCHIGLDVQHQPAGLMWLPASVPKYCVEEFVQDTGVCSMAAHRLAAYCTLVNLLLQLPEFGCLILIWYLSSG
jgi:hypothetical protein